MATNAFNLSDELHTHTHTLKVEGRTSSLWGAADGGLSLERGQWVGKGACVHASHGNTLYIMVWTCLGASDE